MPATTPHIELVNPLSKKSMVSISAENLFVSMACLFAQFWFWVYMKPQHSSDLGMASWGGGQGNIL